MTEKETQTQTGNKSNTGIILLFVTIVILAFVMGYFIFFDKKGYNTSSVRNTPVTSSNKLPILNTNNSPINSAAISSNGGYGGKFNS